MNKCEECLYYDKNTIHCYVWANHRARTDPVCKMFKDKTTFCGKSDLKLPEYVLRSIQS